MLNDESGYVASYSNILKIILHMYRMASHRRLFYLPLTQYALPKYNPQKELLGNRNAARNLPAALCHNTESQPLYTVWFERSLWCVAPINMPAAYSVCTVQLTFPSAQSCKNPVIRGPAVKRSEKLIRISLVEVSRKWIIKTTFW